MKKTERTSERPKVGLGVYVRKNGKVLLCKRKNTLGAGTWSAPGGHIEFGETWQECARRETMEEAGIRIKNIRLMAVTSDVFRKEGKHYITLALVADWASGKPQNREPDKCEGWEWFSWKRLPKPLAVYFVNFKKLGIDPTKF